MFFRVCGTSNLMLWICEKGHKWVSQKEGQEKCPVCGGNKIYGKRAQEEDMIHFSWQHCA